MTRKRLEHFRQRLLQEREALNARILAAQADAQRALGPVEPRDDISERADLADTSLAMATLLTQQLQEIDDALLRMELGEYGVCELCEEPIELERLEARPAARFCKEHARRADQRRPPKL